MELTIQQLLMIIGSEVVFAIIIGALVHKLSKRKYKLEENITCIIESNIQLEGAIKRIDNICTSTKAIEMLDIMKEETESIRNYTHKILNND